MFDNGYQIMEQPAESAGERIVGDGGTLQRVQTGYATAISVQRPRVLHMVEKRLEQEALLAGEDFYYGWSAGGQRIEGPSVNLALAAARCWGNCAVDMLPLSETEDSYVFTAAFVDLETGFTLHRSFRQSKRHAVHGKMDEERKADIRFQIGQSKAIRNVVLNALPPSLIRRTMEAAKSGVRAKIEQYVSKNGVAKAVDLVLGGLAKCGVKEPAVLARCGVAERKAVTLDHLVILRGDLSAIENGQERGAELFPEPAEAKREEAKERTEGVKERLKRGKKQEEKPAEPERGSAEWAGDPVPSEDYSQEPEIAPEPERMPGEDD